MNYKQKKQMQPQKMRVSQQAIDKTEQRFTEVQVCFLRLIETNRKLNYWQDKINFNIKVLSILIAIQILLLLIKYV